jgi:hypothetical protein
MRLQQKSVCCRRLVVLKSAIAGILPAVAGVGNWAVNWIELTVPCDSGDIGALVASARNCLVVVQRASSLKSSFPDNIKKAAP